MNNTALGAENKKEQVNECRQYTVEDLFCCAYAPFFWQAIQIRYPEYATYNRELYAFHVKDLCGLMEVIIRNKPDEHIFNVGNIEAVSIKEWVTICYKSLGKTPIFVNVNETIEQRNYFSFYNYEYYLDVTRQSKIYPKTISLEDGIKDAAKWYLEHRTDVGKKPYFEYIDSNLVGR